MWECSNCDERIDDDLDVCWNCQTSKDGTPPEAYFKSKTVPRELADLQERMSSLPDNDLLRIVSVNFKDYRKEAIALARAELEKRGISPPPRPKTNKEVKSRASRPVNENIAIPARSSIVCSVCAGKLDEDAKFCHWCAAPVVSETPATCPECGKPVSSEGMFCKYCAAELKPRKEIIVTPQPTYSYQSPPQIPQRNKSSNLAVAGAVTAVISAIAVLWGYSYTNSFANTARAGFMNLAGQTDATYTFAQLCVTFGAIGFIIGVVLLIVGLTQR